MTERIKAELVDTTGFDRTITRVAHEILERNRGTARLGLIGIQTRGIFIARRLARKIKEIAGVDVPVGVLDSTMYRDDFRTAPKQPKVKFTEINFDLFNINVVLVDDVIHTGRTVRAAMDAIMDLGRPKRIQLAALVDRGHRELPIKPDYVGKNIPTSIDEEVRVNMTEVDENDAIYLMEVKES